MPLQVTFTDNEPYDFLRLDAGFDATVINTMINTALYEAETFLNTDFSTSVANEDGTVTVTPQEAPPPVKEWVLYRLVQLYENRGTKPHADYTDLQPYRVLPFKGV